MGRAARSHHALVAFKPEGEGFTCDMCGEDAPAGVQLYGCGECDHDACERCYATLPTATLPVVVAEATTLSSQINSVATLATASGMELSDVVKLAADEILRLCSEEGVKLHDEKKIVKEWKELNADADARSQLPAFASELAELDVKLPEETLMELLKKGYCDVASLSRLNKDVVEDFLGLPADKFALKFDRLQSTMQPSDGGRKIATDASVHPTFVVTHGNNPNNGQVIPRDPKVDTHNKYHTAMCSSARMMHGQHMAQFTFGHEWKLNKISTTTRQKLWQNGIYRRI